MGRGAALGSAASWPFLQRKPPWWAVVAVTLSALVPLLATVKIVCDRIGPLMAIGHFLGGETRLDTPETAA